MMKQEPAVNPYISKPFEILLAEDDADDRFFFNKVLKSLPLQSNLVTAVDGELLMTYLLENVKKLPDILFLDLNMPRKNGAECLAEIKQHKMLKHLPVIIYSTHLHEYDNDLFYNKGAHYYIRKTDMMELAKSLHRILTIMAETKFARPAKEKFMFNMETA